MPPQSERDILALDSAKPSPVNPEDQAINQSISLTEGEDVCYLFPKESEHAQALTRPAKTYPLPTLLRVRNTGWATQRTSLLTDRSWEASEQTTHLPSRIEPTSAEGRCWSCGTQGAVFRDLCVETLFPSPTCSCQHHLTQSLPQ